MILIEAEVRPSPIHGLGLFTRTYIFKGTHVARWTPDRDYRCTQEEWTKLPLQLSRFLHDFVWDGHDGYIYGTGDIGRFTNHSYTPNLRWDEQTKTSYAIDDIHAGTELTENYAEFDASFDEYRERLR